MHTLTKAVNCFTAATMGLKCTFHTILKFSLFFECAWENMLIFNTFQPGTTPVGL
ncbi:hypothetical protein NIASO_13320 [Niabella soli DSM 19437]|uniref:Uncharacterized protein n=1 Tax=Niabella soli DSM 19437 TaxID=929713 RepID=W0F3W2_9BACT|nr:hypothetical protein NIASO_13320 [Niabella soli DSM 19437]